MRLRFHPDCTLLTVPQNLFDEFVSYSDDFQAAFANYGNVPMHVVVAWGTTGEEVGKPSAVLVVTRDHIITGYVDRVIGEEDEPPEEWDEQEDGPWIDHNEPSTKERLEKMLAFYRQKARAPYLIVHDADESEPWIAQGFTVVAPPESIPVDEAVHVLIWGAAPGLVYSFLQQRKLSWIRTVHRSG